MPASPVQAALAKIRTARSVDEGDRYAAELARAALDNPQEIIDLYHPDHEAAMTLVRCRQGQTAEPVLDLFRQALRQRSPYVRWAAAEGLKCSPRANLIPLFNAALRDRAHLVIAVAVEWLVSLGDQTSIPALERLLTLPGLARSAPGVVNAAEQAVQRIRDRSQQDADPTCE
jgi:hypothetical protein